LFFILGITDAVYESGLFIAVGLVIAMLGFFLLWRKLKKKGTGISPPKPSSTSSTTPISTPINRMDDLIKEAKYFKDWAIKTGKPGFYGSWAYFLSWLNKKGWGRNEKEIVANFGVSQSDFIKIFNKYGKP
jgi:hypothetical protein